MYPSKGLSYLVLAFVGFFLSRERSSKAFRNSSNVFGSSEGLGGGAVSDMLWLRLIWGDVVEKEMAVVVVAVGGFN